MVTRADVVNYCNATKGTIDQAYKDNHWSRLWGIVGSDYCAAYVSTPFWEMGAPLPSLGVADGFLYVPYAVDYARASGQVTEVPGLAQPGDIVLFTWSGQRYGGPGEVGDHVGLVIGHDGGEWVNTVEGNTSPEGGGARGVHERWRHTDTIACYWRPAVYSDSPAASGPGPEADDLSPVEATMLLALYRAFGDTDRLGRYDGAMIDLHALMRAAQAEPVPAIAGATASLVASSTAPLLADMVRLVGGAAKP